MATVNSLKLRNLAAAILAAISWGAATVTSKGLLAQVPPVTLLLVQLATSVVILWSVVAWRRGGGAGPNRYTVSFAWLGALEPGLAYLLALSGLVNAEASGATLIQATESIMIVAVTAVVSRRLPSRSFLVLSLSALVALAFALDTRSASLGGGNSAVGVLLLVVGTLTAAIYVFLSERTAHVAPTITIVAWQHTVALVVVSIVAAFDIALGQPLLLFQERFTARLWMFCILSGILQFSLPFSLYMFALKGLSANTAGAALLLTPLVGLAGADIFLSERLTAVQWLGSILAVLFVGAMMFSGDDSKLIEIEK